MALCGARTSRVRYAIAPLGCRCGWCALLHYCHGDHLHGVHVHESYAHAREALVFVKSLEQRRWSE